MSVNEVKRAIEAQELLANAEERAADGDKSAAAALPALERRYLALANTVLTGMHKPFADSPDVHPKTLLTGWHQICAALEMPHGRNSDIKSLNDRFEGPITNNGAGTKPMVYREDLIPWWNQLALRQQEMANQRDGKELSASEQYAHGRDGIAAPEVSGSVKKRRCDRT